MKIKCSYCGSYINDTDEKCPNCGAVNNQIKRQAIGVPTTIEELKIWYKEHNLPPEQTTRFFIGKNYIGPRAFGIYQEDNGNFVVYKNKSNSVRVIRYRGTDEAYAVNELYMKLKEEIVNQKRNNNSKKQQPFKEVIKNWIKFAVVCFIFISIICFIFKIEKKKGYYYYNDTYYYYQGLTWYEYNDYSGWDKASTVPSDLKENYSDYYKSSYYSSLYGVDDFSDTEFYHESSDSDDWDSGSSWDSSDSWDSGFTDWDSDW